MRKRPYLISVSLLSFLILPNPFDVSGEQRLVELMFAPDVINRGPVEPFQPGGYCEKESGIAAPAPVIDSTTERRVSFWNQFESTATGVVRHTWFKDDVQQAEVELEVGASPRWRTWSSKRILPQVHAGDWKVVVSTTGDPPESLCVAPFVVK